MCSMIFMCTATYHLKQTHIILWIQITNNMLNTIKPPDGYYMIRASV